MSKNQRQSDYVTDAEHRLIEIEEARLMVKFGAKKRYSAREYEAIYAELAGLDEEQRRDADLVERIYTELNAIDIAAAARRALLE